MGASSSVGSTFSLFQNGGQPKMLVLGCMGCGKSTLVRQLVKQNRSIALKMSYYGHTVQFNLLGVYRGLRAVCDDLNLVYTQIADDFDIIHEFRHREELSDKVVASLRNIASSGIFEECQKKRRVLQLPINYNYFIQHTDRILNPNFVPTEADIFMSYSITMGVNTEMIRIGLSKFEVTELPGHHIFRRYWQKYFNNTAIVCFIVDLSELCDQAFYTGHLKDKTTGIYNTLITNPLFDKTGFILLFNKCDTFEEHAAGFDFRKLASHLRTPEEAKSYYRSLFNATDPRERTYKHIVSLTKVSPLTKQRDATGSLLDSFNKLLKLQRDSTKLE